MLGYSLVVAETATSQRLKDHLIVTSAFDLSNSKMKSGDTYAVIGRSQTHLKEYDILPWIPSPLTLQSPGNKDAWTWLSVKENSNMVVFLIYSEEKKLFDR